MASKREQWVIVISKTRVIGPFATQEAACDYDELVLRGNHIVTQIEKPSK